MVNNWMVRGGIYSGDFEKLLNPPWLELIKKLENPTNFQAFAQHETGVMKFARELEKANYLSSLAFTNSKITRSIEQLTHQNNLMRSVLQQRESMRKFQSIVNSSPLISISGQHKGTDNLLSKLNQLSSFKALTQLQNSPLVGGLSLAAVLEVDTAQPIEGFLLEMDSQISEEVSAATDFNDLSEKTKKVLFYLFHHLFLPFLMGCFATYVMQNAEC